MGPGKSCARLRSSAHEDFTHTRGVAINHLQMARLGCRLGPINLQDLGPLRSTLFLRLGFLAITHFARNQQFVSFLRFCHISQILALAAATANIWDLATGGGDSRIPHITPGFADIWGPPRS